MEFPYEGKDSNMNSLVAFGLVGDETDALHLTDVVESDDSNEGVGVFLLALFQLRQHLRRVGAPEHGELPHGPVASVVVPRQYLKKKKKRPTRKDLSTTLKQMEFPLREEKEKQLSSLRVCGQ
ncbi:hypothetical protein GQ457_05G005640 [Hibiscus cannabinus]